jgi:hypothetical protein
MFAVEVNADDTKFPDDWLFKYRWVGYSHFIGRLVDVSMWKGEG